MQLYKIQQIDNGKIEAVFFEKGVSMKRVISLITQCLEIDERPPVRSRKPVYKIVPLK